MENPEGKATPQLSKTQRMEALDGLLKQFGGSGKIPEEALTGIGYVRHQGEGGSVSFMFAERAEELARRKAAGELLPRHKELPFERIPVTLTTSEQTFRYIPRPQVKFLLAKLKAVEWVFYPCWDKGRTVDQWESGKKRDPDEPEDPVQVQNLRTFFLDYLNFTLEKEQGKISKDAVIELFAKPLPSRLSEDNVTNPNAFLHTNFVGEYINQEDYSIGAMEARAMYDELTRLDGFFGDTRELTSIFQKNLGDSIESAGKSEVSLEDREYLHSLGIQSYADFVRHTFPRYLEHIGLFDMAAVIRTAPAVNEIAETLKYVDTADPFLQEEKDLRKALKSATLEERTDLSKRLKDIDTAKKKRKQLRNGAIDYFNSSALYAEACKVRVKTAKEFLVAGKGELGKNATFFLDARPNPELDKDPGIVSGDCTEGAPLPFDRIDIPVHNVKVFNHAEEHIGNMYLLVTNESGNNKVWHFDAIQIPTSGIDWQTSISAIIESLAEAAEARGIDAITVNKGDEDEDDFHNPLISNYDYIQEAVLKYWKTKGKEETHVDIPEVEDNNEQYSSFQGYGPALILWRRELPKAA